MRLAIIGPTRPWRGGIALHTAAMASAAVERGHESLIVSFRRLYPGLLFPGRSQLEPGAAPPSPDDRNARHLLDPVDPRSWRDAAAELIRFRPDVVVLQRWHPFFQPVLAFLARSARAAGARVTWMVHNAEPHETFRIPRSIARLGMRETDKFVVHAVSESIRLRALGISGVATVRGLPVLGGSFGAHDSEAARKRVGIPSEDVLFLFFGYVRRYKGVDLFLDSLARLAPEGRPWQAIIAGEWYVDRSAADALVGSPRVGGRVRIIDRFVPDEEARDLFEAATAVVLPYREATQSGVVPLAWAHGKPVVTTAVGGLPDVVVDGENGLLVPPGDITALCRALEEIRAGRRFHPARIASAAMRASWGDLVDAVLEL